MRCPLHGKLARHGPYRTLRRGVSYTRHRHVGLMRRSGGDVDDGDVLALNHVGPSRFAKQENDRRFFSERAPEVLFGIIRSEEHTSELQSLMRISSAVFCLKQKTTQPTYNQHYYTRSNHRSENIFN